MEKFKKVPTISGQVSFSPRCTPCSDAQYRVVQVHNNTGKRVGTRDREGRPEALATLGEQVPAARGGEEARRHPPGLLRLAFLRGRSGARGRHARAPSARGRRPHRPERRREVDARERADRVRLDPTAGSVELAGRRITRWSAHRRARAGLARTFQHSRSFRDLSVRENVEVAALGVGAGPRKARRRADDLLELLGLEGQGASSPAGSLAHGDERRLGVARALATEPRFVLMDEPAAGLPEAEVPDFASVVRSVRDDVRRRRAADRPQHGARDERLRPDRRARPGPDARRRDARGDPRETSTSPPPTSGRRRWWRRTDG